MASFGGSIASLRYTTYGTPPLSEYNMLQPLDPTQTFAFLPSGPSTSRFTALDPLSRYAASFAFSTGTVDFGPLMVHVLMANGDICTMGPVLPSHAELPMRYLQGLKAYTDGTMRRLNDGEDENDPEHEAMRGKAALQAQWVDSVVRQVKQADESRRQREEEQLYTPSRRSSLLGGRHRQSGTPGPTDDRRSQVPEGMVRVHPPHLTDTGGPAPGLHRSLTRQGPAAYSPPPQEIGVGADEEEQVASDLFIFSAPGGKETAEELSILVIAWSGGRVDIGIATEAPEPRWISSRVSELSSTSGTI